MAYLFKAGREHPVIMTYITKEEEDKLDKREPIVLERGNEVFQVTRTNTHYYGEIDFNQNSEDYRILENSRLFFPLEFRGVPVPANYDYEKHMCYSDINKPRWYDTVNAALICKFSHGILNKPKRVVIFEV